MANKVRADIKNEDIQRLWAEGKTMNAISRELNCGVGLVRSRLVKLGVKDSSMNHSAGGQRHYDEEAEQMWPEIKADFDAGMTMTPMVAKYHMTRERFRRLFEKYGYDYEGVQAACKAKADEAYLEQLADLRDAGKTVKEIGVIIGKSESMTRADLQRFGLTKMPDRTDISDEQILDLWNTGISIHQIAVQCGCSHDTVTKRLAKHGITGSKSDDVIPADTLNSEEIFDKRGKKFLDDLNAKVIRNELFIHNADVYLRDLNVGINFVPTYRSSVDLTDVFQNRCQVNALLAEADGVGLIHMFDADFLDNRVYECLLNQLSARNSAIHHTEIGARHCAVRLINRQESNEFLNTYHFQGGENNSSVQYGLFYNDVLVGVLTVGASRYTDDDYEIIRYCMYPGYRISGCFGKLFHHFCKGLTEDAVIVSYMDLNKRFTASNVYERNGFEYDGLTPPDYTWYNRAGTDMKSRYSVTKQQLVNRGFDKTKSEIEIMKSQGYYRVYGAGSKRYKYHHIVK